MTYIYYTLLSRTAFSRKVKAYLGASYKMQ